MSKLYRLCSGSSLGDIGALVDAPQPLHRLGPVPTDDVRRQSSPRRFQDEPGCCELSYSSPHAALLDGVGHKRGRRLASDAVAAMLHSVMQGLRHSFQSALSDIRSPETAFPRNRRAGPPLAAHSLPTAAALLGHSPAARCGVRRCLDGAGSLMGLHTHGTAGRGILTVDDLNTWLEHVFLPLVYGYPTVCA
jgi:hypothetical protein